MEKIYICLDLRNNQLRNFCMRACSVKVAIPFPLILKISQKPWFNRDITHFWDRLGPFSHF